MDFALFLNFAPFLGPSLLSGQPESPFPEPLLFAAQLPSRFRPFAAAAGRQPLFEFPVALLDGILLFRDNLVEELDQFCLSVPLELLKENANFVGTIGMRGLERLQVGPSPEVTT